VDEVIARGVATAVPPFRSLCRVQDKLAAAELLAELAIPRPAGAVVTSAEQLRDVHLREVPHRDGVHRSPPGH
jgi:hypothetical protein